ncbi:hypothetical protein Leryth_011400 [Lithospermum erythrorhizon]|nr:hypothetical protein Leryth_011400 [Lithospermum erythrorhizon]
MMPTLLLLLLLTVSASASNGPKNYIIHVSKWDKPPLFTTHKSWYSSIVNSLSPLSNQPSRILYTYEHVAHGFSATLTTSQATILTRIPGIISVIPDQIQHLHTTRTPRFLGLADSYGIWPNSDYADDVVVGVLDTGIWPERESFDDTKFSPIPSTWKGSCEDSKDFPKSLCNNKLIGAKAFYKSYEAYLGQPMDESIESKSPRDTEGHGTHTSSTAAGSVVANASLLGYAKGEARGMAIKARIAMYKICWSLGCFDGDILAAFDEAVADGVDVISLSVGASGLAPRYDHDTIAIGAFGAIQHGVVVSCSAGNSGPGPYTAVNIAPWILTVGASTIDREFPADAVLGDGRVFGGVSLYSGEPIDDKQIPLVYAADCGGQFCFSGKLDPAKVAGKIVICDRGTNARVEKGSAVKLAGGAGMILANLADAGEELLADAHLIATTMVGEKAGNQIKEYVKSDPSPTATIVFKGTVISTDPSAPRVAAFSSRGPNHLTPEIIKPDVIAPGVNILAGWTGNIGPTDLEIDPRRVDFNIISGTSMSCPHVSGLAALLRKAYPSWTPSAIKSALMTTASNLDNIGKNITDLASGEESTPFVHGSGHVDPNTALKPGLVYDLEVSDYIAWLCSIGYDSKKISVFLRESVTVDCSTVGLDAPGNLNYPSFGVVFAEKNSVVKYKRVVKNVGKGKLSVYKVKINAPPYVKVSVSPNKLVFTEGVETLSYEISFTSVGRGGKSEFGSIEWRDGVHVVRSPIAVSWSGGSAASM